MRTIQDRTLEHGTLEHTAWEQGTLGQRILRH